MTNEEKFYKLLNNFFNFPHVQLTYSNLEKEVTNFSICHRNTEDRLNYGSDCEPNRIYYSPKRIGLAVSEARNPYREISIALNRLENVDDFINWIKKVDFQPEILLEGIEQ